MLLRVVFLLNQETADYSLGGLSLDRVTEIVFTLPSLPFSCYTPTAASLTSICARTHAVAMLNWADFLWDVLSLVVVYPWNSGPGAEIPQMACPASASPTSSDAFTEASLRYAATNHLGYAAGAARRRGIKRLISSHIHS